MLCFVLCLYHAEKIRVALPTEEAVEIAQQLSGYGLVIPYKWTYAYYYMQEYTMTAQASSTMSAAAQSSALETSASGGFDLFSGSASASYSKADSDSTGSSMASSDVRIRVETQGDCPWYMNANLGGGPPATSSIADAAAAAASEAAAKATVATVQAAAKVAAAKAAAPKEAAAKAAAPEKSGRRLGATGQAAAKAAAAVAAAPKEKKRRLAGKECYVDYDCKSGKCSRINAVEFFDPGFCDGDKEEDAAEEGAAEKRNEVAKNEAAPQQAKATKATPEDKRSSERWTWGFGSKGPSDHDAAIKENELREKEYESKAKMRKERSKAYDEHRLEAAYQQGNLKTDRATRDENKLQTLVDAESHLSSSLAAASAGLKSTQAAVANTDAIDGNI